MNPYASALGTYIGRVFDGKTIISLALIGCTTLLAWNRILDTAAWSLMVTTVALRGASRRRPARQLSGIVDNYARSRAGDEEMKLYAAQALMDSSHQLAVLAERKAKE